MQNARAAVVVMSIALIVFFTSGLFKRHAFRKLGSKISEVADDVGRRIHPLLITVTIDKERRVFLDLEPAGTTEDVALLKEKLAEAMARRNRAIDAGAAKGPPTYGEEGSRRTVYVEARWASKYGEIAKVIEVIEGLGGEPIALHSSLPTKHHQ